MRKRKRLWVLMYKRDGRDKVWVYEKLRKKRDRWNDETRMEGD